MRVFFDSSAFAKRFIEEIGSQEIDNICQSASEIGLSIICSSEIFSALNRRLREQSITKSDYILAKNCFAKELFDIQIINITSKVVTRTIILLEENILRAMDALHIACAIEWKTELFVTSDYRQVNAAQNAKLNTRII